MGDIGHRADGEVDVVESMQVQPVGGGLQDRHVAPCVDHAAQEALVLDRLLGGLPEGVAILGAGDPDRHRPRHPRRLTAGAE